MKHLAVLIVVLSCYTATQAQTDPNFFKYKSQADDCFAKKDYPCADKWYRAALVVKANDDDCKDKLAKTRQAKKEQEAEVEKQRQEQNKKQQHTKIDQDQKEQLANAEKEKQRLADENTALKTRLAEAERRKEIAEKKEMAINERLERNIVQNIEMVYVLGGSFMMGSNEGEEDEKPVRRVTVGSFYMGKYEVTQAQWRAVMGKIHIDSEECDDCPMYAISWDYAQEFLTKLNARTGKQYRLPTEAEWEYAAGGGATNRTRFGNGKNILDPNEANFDGSVDFQTYYSVAGIYREKVVPVGSFSPNALGLYDMTGNVFEWCDGWYKGYFGNVGIPDHTNIHHVLRGGSWISYPKNSRVSFRNDSIFTFNGENYGFRVVSTQ